MQGLFIVNCKLKTENERLTIKKEDIFHKISNTNDSKITLAVFFNLYSVNKPKKYIESFNVSIYLQASSQLNSYTFFFIKSYSSCNMLTILLG